MDLQDIKTLTGILADALREEYEAKVKAEEINATAEANQARRLLIAYAEGVIDGTNADIRKRQEIVTLRDDEENQKEMVGLSIMNRHVNRAEIERKRVEAVISLTRAWLYSQRPTP